MINRGFSGNDYNNEAIEKLMKKFEKILQLGMKAELDIKNKVESLHSIILIDPFDQANSMKRAVK